MEKLMTKFRETFENIISRKTGWGNNEIMRMFDVAMASSSLAIIDELNDIKKKQEA